MIEVWRVAPSQRKLIEYICEITGDKTSAIQIETIATCILDWIRHELSSTWRFCHCQ